MDEKNLSTLRHSTAHVMAHAVKNLFPDAKITIGPAIEEGFYYDFDVKQPFTPEDLEKISEEMSKIVTAKRPFVRKSVSKDEARAMFADEKFKLEIIDELPEDEEVTVYEEGDFTDLCRGPHLENTGEIGAFKLLRSSGAYWRGDEKNPMLQRIKELQESEARFRVLFESAADSLLLSNQDGQFVQVNQKACDILGYSCEELLQMSAPDVVVDFGKEEMVNTWNTLLETGEVTVYAHYRRKDGSTIPIEARLKILDWAGRPHVLAVARDISERIRAEEERRAHEQRVEQQKRQFYRQTIYSVTEGKLDICEQSDVEPFLANSQISITVDRPDQVPGARIRIEEFLLNHKLDPERLSHFILGVGEAITNAVKHGKDGRVFAGVGNGNLWVGIEDHGPGIDSLILPHALLLRGFSTKPSLGLGYSVMLDVSDRIHLKTDGSGTIVILEKDLAERNPVPSLENIPDTWNAISI